jgi:hypothetical protein
MDSPRRSKAAPDRPIQPTPVPAPVKARLPEAALTAPGLEGSFGVEEPEDPEDPEDPEEPDEPEEPEEPDEPDEPDEPPLPPAALATDVEVWAPPDAPDVLVFEDGGSVVEVPGGSEVEVPWPFPEVLTLTLPEVGT